MTTTASTHDTTPVRQSGRVVQINVSPGGVPKLPVPAAHVDTLGLEGDGHNDKLHHGGPERAVCLFSMELIEALRAEGHPIAPGTTGENLTLSGIDFAAIQSGDHLRVGEHVLLELTRHTTPCKNITDSFKDGDFTRISQKLHPGESRIYARVVEEGEVRAGDPVQLLERAEPTPEPSAPA